MKDKKERRIIKSLPNKDEKLYNPRLYYHLGVLESIIELAFENQIDAHQVVDDIEKRLEEIKSLIGK